MHICNDCCVELTADNWSPSYERGGSYLCRACAVKRTQKYEASRKEARRAYLAAYYIRNKERILQRQKEWQRTHQPQMRETARRYHSNHFEARNAKTMANYRKVREEVLQAYGHACVCCGETRGEFLAIDHVNNDGAVHRREIGGSGKQIYFWLKQHGCPQDGRFVLSCHNCNCARAFYGVCPHVTDRAQEHTLQHD